MPYHRGTNSYIQISSGAPNLVAPCWCLLAQEQRGDVHVDDVSQASTSPLEHRLSRESSKLTSRCAYITVTNHITDRPALSAENRRRHLVGTSAPTGTCYGGCRRTWQAWWSSGWRSCWLSTPDVDRSLPVFVPLATLIRRSWRPARLGSSFTRHTEFYPYPIVCAGRI